MNCPSIKVPLRLLRGVTRTITLAIKDGDGEPLDLSGVELRVVVSRDGSYDRYEPEITLRGEDNNLVVFIWPADRQALGCYTIDIRGDFGDIGIGRTNWHGPDGIEIVEYANQATEREVADLTVEEVELEGTMETAAGNVIYYIKPADGIPASDMTQEVQDSLALADSAYQKPQTGIPATDLAQAVQTSLGKADSAYQKPVSGIPSSDMTEAVRTSLGKADTAVQWFEVTYNVTTAKDIADAVSAGKQPRLLYQNNVFYYFDNFVVSDTIQFDFVCIDLGYNVRLITVSGPAAGDDEIFTTSYGRYYKQIPDAQIQSDWNQASSSAKDFIKNKPDLSGFITKSVNDLVYYYTKSETYTQTEINNLIGAIDQFRYEIYASTSAITDPASNILYLIGPTGSGADRYEEYVYANNAFVKIGDTSIDLSSYVTTSALNTALADYTTTTDLTTLLSGKVDKVAGKGLSTNDYTDGDKTKLGGIAAGAEVNVIETVKVNGTALPVINKAVNIIIETPDTSVDLSMVDAAGNPLASPSTANTYIVRAAGSYKFPLVYGNGIKAGAVNSAAYTRQGTTYTADFVNHLGNTLTSPYIEQNTGCTAASAALLWQTAVGMITSVEIVSGVDCRYIRFHVSGIPATNGLACLAVKNSSGDIMWSWTIWLTTDGLIPLSFENHTEVEYDLMSEAVGTIWNADRSNALYPYYQWGRKDIIGIPAAYNSTEQMPLFDIDGENVAFDTYGIYDDEDQGGTVRSIANSIKKPMSYFHRYQDYGSWYNTSACRNLWNAANTGGTGASDSQATAIKTIYDPSPVGFMVPAARFSTGFTTTGGYSETPSEYNVVNETYIPGWRFKRNATDTVGNFFPASGHIVYNSDYTISEIADTGTYWSYEHNDNGVPLTLEFYPWGISPLNSDFEPSGNAVRPTKEL